MRTRAKKIRGLGCYPGDLIAAAVLGIAWAVLIAAAGAGIYW